MAVDNGYVVGDNRDDDYIIQQEQKPIPDPDPNHVIIPPTQTGQVEACNDFAPPRLDAFDIEAAPIKFKAAPPSKPETTKSSGSQNIGGIASALGGFLRGKFKASKTKTILSGNAPPFR